MNQAKNITLSVQRMALGAILLALSWTARSSGQDLNINIPLPPEPGKASAAEGKEPGRRKPLARSDHRQEARRGSRESLSEAPLATKAGRDPSAGDEDAEIDETAPLAQHPSADRPSDLKRDSTGRGGVLGRGQGQKAGPRRSSQLESAPRVTRRHRPERRPEPRPDYGLESPPRPLEDPVPGPQWGSDH